MKNNNLDVNIKLSDCIAPIYDTVLLDMLSHKYTNYVFPGGRGTYKSSFAGVSVPLLIMENPLCHAVCFRKVGNTVQKSIRSQIEWGIQKLGVSHLFSIPKSYANPIVYKPTGQQIIFMGLDDPNKVKSIKLPFGYIGITWWEELDQFSGEAELRKVLQSTRRGGDKFWDIRTFNPPISRNNWANAYADSAETRENTLVLRTNYLNCGAPREWLGDQFFEDANELKEINPKAYEHEYLGIPVGTGGDVFPNVSDLDMSEEITIGGVKMPRYKTFGNIYAGIDWGYSRDPFRFVKMYFDARHLDLYIFCEYSTLKTRNEDVYNEIFNELKICDNQQLITADSAEQKSVDDFKAYGAFIRPAIKGPESVRYGIKWLQGLRNIYIDKKLCPLTYNEFINYEYEQDRDGNFISSYPDANNHSIDAVRYALESYWKRKGN